MLRRGPHPASLTSAAMTASVEAALPDAPRTDRTLARYVRRSVYAYSAHYRASLDSSGLGPRGVRARADLAHLPPIHIGRLGDPGGLALRPDAVAIRRFGDRRLAARLGLAMLLGTVGRLNRRVLEPRFKPIHWVLIDGLTVGYSAADLRRLGELGARWLRLAGVGARDIVVETSTSKSTIAHWALVEACRTARVTLVPGAVGHAGDLARLAPSVMVGPVTELVATLEAAAASGRLLDRVNTVLCIGEPVAPTLAEAQRIAGLLPQAVVLRGWVPRGGRSVWTECREAALGRTRSDDAPFHAWPDADVLEVVADAVDGWSTSARFGDGELLSTGLGWGGTALLRVWTEAVVTLDPGACPWCRRPGPLVTPMEAATARWWRAATRLDRDPEVAAWDLEQRVVGGVTEMIVTLAADEGVDPTTLVERLDVDLRPTQFIVVDRHAIEPGRQPRFTPPV